MDFMLSIKTGKPVQSITVRSPKTRVSIRSLKAEDAQHIATEANDISIALNVSSLGTFPYPYRDADAIDFINKEIVMMDAGKQYPMCIIDPDGRFVGMIEIRIMNKKLDGDIGYWIGRAHRRKSYTTDAAKLILGFGFTYLGLSYITARAHKENIGSISVLKKCGMEIKGEIPYSSFTTSYPEKYASFMDMCSNGATPDEAGKALGLKEDVINSWNKRFILKTDNFFDLAADDIPRTDLVFGISSKDYNYDVVIKEE